MQGILTWAGENATGKAAAILLLYIVAGSITGSVLATQDERPCWPQATFTTVYAPDCENEAVGQGWLIGVSMPNTMLQGPVNALVLATSGYSGYFGIIDTFTILVTPVIAFFGIAGWLRWSPAVAAVLALALIGEVVYLRTLVPV